jgi:catalase
MANYDYSTTMTDEFGHAIPNDLHSLSAGPTGPILLQDYFLVNKLAHFDRERIPERVVHAKGAGAHGYLEVTHDVTKYTKAAFLNKVGKRTPLFLRFSTVGGEKGSADTARDPRGFAIKFYTEEGNYDLVGNNTPVFFIRDTIKFPDFIHTQKRNPESNLHDADMFWDFLSLTPESIHQVTILFSDFGTPYSYRHMHGYGSHTYKLVNKRGEAFWTKFHFHSDQGHKNLTIEEAIKLAGEDPDHTTRDLFDNIKNGNFPSWTASIQVMPVDDAAKYRYDVFDVTKVWPHKDYPLIPFGKLVLNRNPTNYFAETEQSAFSPANLVPGIEASQDKMLQGRLFSYNDTHRHRLGPNYTQIPINAPLRSKLNTYYRDGFMTVNGNGGSGPNYFPNSFNGPKPAEHLHEHKFNVNATVARTNYVHPNNDFEQAGALFRNVMGEHERSNLIHNIVIHLRNARKDIQLKQIQNFLKADKEYGRRVAEGLGLSNF